MLSIVPVLLKPIKETLSYLKKKNSFIFSVSRKRLRISVSACETREFQLQGDPCSFHQLPVARVLSCGLYAQSPAKMCSGMRLACVHARGDIYERVCSPPPSIRQRALSPRCSSSSSYRPHRLLSKSLPLSYLSAYSAWCQPTQPHYQLSRNSRAEGER